MSGGYYNYTDNDLREQIFGWNDREPNPFEDYEVSNIVRDMFDLIHSFDLYKEGDCNKEDYVNDVKQFKRKWFDDHDKTQNDIIDKAINDLRKELVESFGEPVIKKLDREFFKDVLADVVRDVNLVYDKLKTDGMYPGVFTELADITATIAWVCSVTMIDEEDENGR